MNEMKKPLDSGFFQFVGQRGFVSDTPNHEERTDRKKCVNNEKT